MPRNDNDPEIAALARVSIEEFSDEDLLDYFGHPPEPSPAIVRASEPLDEEIPF